MPAGRIISRNDSPDVPFDLSINPYQGCEHGCIYCYARPSHSYLDLSPGLDFETQIFYKPNGAARLLEEWEKPGYECKPITIGANTDPYQPAEKSLKLTRKLLLLFLKHRHGQYHHQGKSDLPGYRPVIGAGGSRSLFSRAQPADHGRQAEAHHGTTNPVGRRKTKGDRAARRSERSNQRARRTDHPRNQRQRD
jgi:hypothetical protein